MVSTPRELNQRYNFYHLSRWPLDKLLRGASASFSSIETYGQDWDTAVIDQIDVEANDFYLLVCTR